MELETELAGSICLFSALMSAIERTQVELIELMEMSQKAVEKQAEAVLRKLEQENKELQRRVSALEELAQSDDFTHCIKVGEASVRWVLDRTLWKTLNKSWNSSRCSPRSSSLPPSKTGQQCPSAPIWEQRISTESWQFRWSDSTKSWRMWQKKVWHHDSWH